MTNKPLKIMYLNPVAANPEVDAIFAEMARDHKLPGTEVHVTALPKDQYGFSHIEFRTYEALVTRGIMRAVRAAAQEGFDALAIGCFYDTALHDAREISGDMIITAPCVASCEIAASLVNRFGIIVGRRKWVNQMHANVVEYGHGERLAGFYEVGLGVDDFQKDHDETAHRLKQAGRKAVEEGYAEALILGCTMEIGFYKELEEELGVPVIDPSIAALKRAEYAALLKQQCGWGPGRTWSCEPPSETEMAKFDAFGGDEPVFGSRIIIAAN
jgi:allantoin racemase